MHKYLIYYYYFDWSNVCIIEATSEEEALKIAEPLINKEISYELIKEFVKIFDLDNIKYNKLLIE